MEQFTKGPWQVKGDWMIVDSTDRLIAQFEPLNDELSNSNTPESFANAALISAAPEMYEMLKLILSVYEMDYDDTDKALKLLAKVRGEQ